MRFLLDQDVDARVVRVFQDAGHVAWTVAQAGLAEAKDDAISAYAASKRATVVTHDAAFSARRRKNPHGRHVRLDCKERDAVALVSERLSEIVASLEPFDDVCVYVSKSKVVRHTHWT